MPQDDVALEVLAEVGPMAVTSANRTGQPPATTVTDAAAQLGAAVEVYLDAGSRADNALDDRRLSGRALDPARGALSADRLAAAYHPLPARGARGRRSTRLNHRPTRTPARAFARAQSCPRIDPTGRRTP